MNTKRESNRRETALLKEAVEVEAELGEEELSQVSGGKGSTSLFEKCCTGKHIKAATIVS
jgi:type VI protein secretion system component Hcp